MKLFGKKRDFLYFICVFGVVLGILYHKTGWPLAMYDGGLETPQYDSMIVGENEITGKDLRRLRFLMTKLWIKEQILTSHPDLIIKGIRSGNTDIYSVWLDEGYIYAGEYEAGKRAQVHRLNRKVTGAIKDYMKI